MNINKKLASQLAGVMAIALLVGTSAFAEDRHRDETNRGGEHREMHQRDANQNSGQSHVDSYRNRATNETRTHDRRGDTRGNNNNFDRDRTNRENRDNRTYTQNDRNYGQSNAWRGNNDHRYDNRNNDRYRGNNRGYGNDHRYDNRSRGNEYRGNPYHAHGRISRIDRWNGGFRVYIGGAPYPFFVPEARFRLFNWRVGLDIGLGGYYNPLGYYDYYDDAYNDGAAVSAGALRGVVETVDFRRGSFVLRDDVSGSFVTVLMRGGDRTFDAIRPGDYVDVAGDWSRTGLFEAYRADLLDDGYNRR